MTHWVIVVLLGFSCWHGPVHGQRYHLWQHITSSNGLPQNSVMDLALDNGGYLWITTEGGLVRYDGRWFKQFQLPKGGPEYSVRMRQLIQTADGQLMVDDARGNLYLIHGHMSAVQLRKEALRVHFEGRVPTPRIYLQLVDTAMQLPGTHSWRGRPTDLLSRSSAKWHAVDGDRLLHYEDTVLMDAVDLPEGHRGLVLLGDHIVGFDATDGQFRVDPGSGAIHPLALAGMDRLPEQLRSQGNRFLWSDPYLFLFHQGKLHRLAMNTRGDTLRAMPMDLELPTGTGVNSILYSAEHELLALATSTKGLYLYRTKPMRTLYCEDEALKDNSFYGQADLGERGILALRSNLMTVTLSPEEGCKISDASLQYIGISGLVRGGDDRYWCVQNGTVTAIDPYTGNAWQPGNIREGPATFLAEGDSTWVGTVERIGYFKNDSVRSTHKVGGTSYRDNPLVLRRGPDGHLWYGSCKGLFRSVDRFGKAFEPVREFQEKCVRAVEPMDDILFVGTYGEGLYALINGTVKALPLDSNRVLKEVHAIVRTEDDHLWISTNNGFIRTTMADIRTYLADRTERPYYAHYGAWTNMLSTEMNGGCEPAWIRTTAGYLSFPSLDGLVQFDPQMLPDPWPRAEILTGRISVDGKPWSLFDRLVLTPDVQQVTIEVSMPYWGDRHNAQLEYRIPGVENDWVQLGPEAQQITIVRPPPGNFELYLRKVGSKARGETQEPLLWFSVEPTFMRSWKGYTLIAVLFMLITLLGSKLYSDQLVRKTRRLERYVAAQTGTLLQMNRELKRTLGHQETLVSITSHDIVGPLRFIMRVAKSASRMHGKGTLGEDLGNTLHDLALASEKLHSSARSLLDWAKHQQGNPISPNVCNIALNPFVENAFKRVEEMARNRTMELVNRVDLDVIVQGDPDLLHIIVNNALVNTLVHSNAQRVEVGCSPQDTGVEVWLNDNGNGLPPEQLAHVQRVLDHAGNENAVAHEGPAMSLGYVIMSECARIMGITIRVDSDTAGTVVRLMLPGSLS